MGLILKDASVFTYKYMPSAILHREEQVRELESRINNPLYDKPAKNTMIYGLSGTGKTLTTKHLTDELLKKATNTKICYVRLKGAQTEYKAINKVTQALMGVEFDGRSPSSVYTRIFDYLKHHEEKYTIFIFDEIDSILQNYDNFLDAFLRPYENHDMGEKEVSVIMISNNMTFPKDLSIGTKSSYDCMDKLVFAPYNADHLKDILTERADKGLNTGTYDEVVIPLCAAYGAQEHGDARRTIELLGKAAAIAEREGSTLIQEKHVKQAHELIEFEGVAQVLMTLPTHSKAVALAISKESKTKPESTTVSIYSEYKNMCKHIGMTTLSQRRISDILVEFSNLGLINSKLIYKGGEGRSRYVELSVPASIVDKVIMEDSRFEGLKADEPMGLEKFLSRGTQP